MIHLGMSVCPSVNALDQKYRIQENFHQTQSDCKCSLESKFIISLYFRTYVLNTDQDHHQFPSVIHNVCMCGLYLSVGGGRWNL